MRSTELTDSETDPQDTVEDGEDAALPAVTVTAFPRTKAGADVAGAVEEAIVNDVDDDDECEDDIEVDGLEFCVAAAADRVTLSERLGQDRSLAKWLPPQT